MPESFAYWAKFPIDPTRNDTPQYEQRFDVVFSPNFPPIGLHGITSEVTANGVDTTLTGVRRYEYRPFTFDAAIYQDSLVTAIEEAEKINRLAGISGEISFVPWQWINRPARILEVAAVVDPYPVYTVDTIFPYSIRVRALVRELEESD